MTLLLAPAAPPALLPTPPAPMLGAAPPPLPEDGVVTPAPATGCEQETCYVSEDHDVCARVREKGETLRGEGIAPRCERLAPACYH